MNKLTLKMNSRILDYSKIKEDCVIINKSDTETEYDINFLIPVRNRIEFSEPMFNSFKDAANNSNLNITYTVIEHDSSSSHARFCRKNKINYIWIPSKKDDLFNKCSAYNMGALYGPKSKSLIFHDIDCLLQKDFFIKLEENIKRKKAKAIQCFTGRRVLYLSPSITPNITSGEIDINEISIDHPEVSLPQFVGAPGGSIYVERDLFNSVGGYDAELFQANSPEDSFFWEKIDAFDKMHICDDPEIELFHMYHDPTYYSNPKIEEMKQDLTTFKSMSKIEKEEYINDKSKTLTSFYNE